MIHMFVRYYRSNQHARSNRESACLCIDTYIHKLHIQQLLILQNVTFDHTLQLSSTKI